MYTKPYHRKTILAGVKLRKSKRITNIECVKLSKSGHKNNVLHKSNPHMKNTHTRFKIEAKKRIK